MFKLRTPCLVALLFIIFFLIFVSFGCGQTTKTTAPATESQQEFVGSINSNKYHYPSCEWAQKIYPENEIWFSSSEEAQAQEYVPCKICCPP